MGNQNFFSDVFGEMSHISKTGWTLFLLMAAISAVSEFVHWLLGPEFTPYDWAVADVLVSIWLLATYVMSMGLVLRQSHEKSFVRFVVATMAIISPIMAGAGAILILLPSGNKDTIVAVSLSLMGIGLILITFLPAFPVAQALSTSFVSPMAMLRATKGHRWSLIFVSVATGSINKVVPETSTARNIWEAYALSTGNGLTGTFQAVLVTCLGVTAWRFAVRNDQSLRGDVPQAD